MTALELVSQVKENYRNVKSIFSIVNTPEFLELFTQTNEEERKLIYSYIKSNNKKALVDWIHRKKGTYPVFKLRELAKTLKIKNYLRLSGHQLWVKLISQYGEDFIRSNL